MKTPLTSRLAVRVYLIGLGQTAVIAAGFFGIMEASRAGGPGPGEVIANYLADGISDAASDQARLDKEIARIRGSLRSIASVYDEQGKVIVSSDPEHLVRCSAPRHDGRPPFRACATKEAVLYDGRKVTVELVAFGGPASPNNGTGFRILALVLLVVGLSAWILARSLTRPLLRMAETARAFGNGDLKARVGSTRGDEIGQVSRAFDDMAARVTELLRAEKELIANVSHELRTPLARIRVALDLANEGDATLLQESLADIGIDLTELETLISDVLTAARLELEDGPGSSGLPPLRCEEVRVSGLLDQAASRFRSAHPARELALHVSLGDATLDADRMLLRRVVDNLLENAHKYTPQKDAPITLQARVDGSHVIIEIADCGIGISSEDLPLVFRPFFRADRSRTRATGGLGLGLALSKRIVEAHGGTIAIASVPDAGTTATVRLPSEHTP